jgi:predicted CopG family antitoxin
MEYKQSCFTTIAISKENYELLKQYGKFRETFNDILTRLLSTKRDNNLEKEVIK